MYVSGSTPSNMLALLIQPDNWNLISSRADLTMRRARNQKRSAASTFDASRNGAREVASGSHNVAFVELYSAGASSAYELFRIQSRGLYLGKIPEGVCL
jgi:hypothetical protein